MKNLQDDFRREYEKKHFMFNKFSFRKSCRLWDNMEKYGRAEEATDEYIAHAHCMLDT